MSEVARCDCAQGKKKCRRRAFRELMFPTSTPSPCADCLLLDHVHHGRPPATAAWMVTR